MLVGTYRTNIQEHDRTQLTMLPCKAVTFKRGQSWRLGRATQRVRGARKGLSLIRPGLWMGVVRSLSTVGTIKLLDATVLGRALLNGEKQRRLDF